VANCRVTFSSFQKALADDQLSLVSIGAIYLQIVPAISVESPSAALSRSVAHADSYASEAFESLLDIHHAIV
jgi:hypothetical protein